ncbi:restriction endonuclease [Streptomyces sp. NBC_00555]|uniref:restriction endonuclease n=1 Tax=Streptomyces sp. NBC_00555 TaxID=2903662 RepID=UPI002251FC45|nr:restriction endonuclease [Streptomyces sp. NBC_00555]MCX5014248.1 restriction endonuclease [Streptomyces sp. NBC_00555]
MNFESVFSSIEYGHMIKGPASEGACAASEPGAVRLLRYKDLGRDGSIAEPDEESDIWRSDIPEKSHLQPGDLLLSVMFPNRPRAARVEESDLPAAAGRNLAVLRPSEALSAEHARLIITFLSSEGVSRLARGANVRHFSIRDLRLLELPKPDEALSAALDELHTAGQRMLSWSAEATALAGSVFDTGTSLEDARRSIIEAGQLTRLRTEAAAQLDDLGYIVRTRFPYPIALRWREVEARMSASDLAPAYEAVLDAAEALLGYTALVTGALSREAAIELASIGALQRKLSSAPGGPGFGEWTAVLQEISGVKKRRGLRLDHPLHELATLLGSEEAQQARIRLADRRNSKAHGRGPDAVTLPAALEEAFRDLSLLVSGARFLADMPLIHVTSVAWDAFRGEASIMLRRLMGDHPVVPTSTMKVPSNSVETGSLYLTDRDHHLYLLRPFLTCEVCETCHTWSTFHADKEKGNLVQKSLEHGHHYPYRADTQVLQLAGLL